MGSAIIQALLKTDDFNADTISVCDTNPEKLTAFASHGIFVSENPEEVVSRANFVILAVKPQQAGELLRLLNGVFLENAVLISIAAGLSADFLQKTSGVQKIARIMPNTPALVQKGVSGIYTNPKVLPEEREYIEQIFSGLGIVIPCESEEMIDAITALSGSGPAYFFRILEIMSEQAESFGFSAEVSPQIALHTLLGAGALAKESGEDFSALREKVTSKGGTTAAALEAFEKMELSKVLQGGMTAAFERAKELGK